MSTDANHLGEELDLLLDGRLPPDRERAVQAHLEDCARCRREMEAIRVAKFAAREGVLEHAVPTTLRARVAESIDFADRDRSKPAPLPRRPRRRALIGFGLAAAAALVLLLWRVTDRPDFVLAAARDLSHVRAATLPLEFATTDAAALEREFARMQMAFPVRVFDFAMMGYALAGGRVHRIDGRTSALFAYRSADGRNIVCQMYAGRTAELPAGYEEHEQNGIRFRVYRVGQLTLVFWQEGRIVCVLTSDGPADVALQLAYAKAVRIDPA